jgi:putative ABC transport system permease protein
LQLEIMLISLWNDLRFAWRMLRKSPGFTLTAIITLALGIGGNTAVFTVMNAVLLRALPYQDPRQLVLINAHHRGDAADDGGTFTLNRYELVRDHNRSFSGVAVAVLDSFNLTGRGEPQQVPVARVSPNFFGVLGLHPQLGRSFTDDEGQPGGKPVVMITDAMWHSRFGADPKVIGQSVTLDSAPYTVIGVLPAGIHFPFLGPAEIWSPRYFELTLLDAAHLRAGTSYLTAVARLKPGTSIRSAAAELEVLHQRYSADNLKAPDSGADFTMVVGNLAELTVANVRLQLLLLSAAVGLLLLIACANVASLLLTRALARKREFAVRSALGAPRNLLIRQLLMESVLLALISGMLGLWLGFAGTRTLGVLAQSDLPPGFDITMDGQVLLFAMGVSLLTGFLFGMFPALQLSRTDVNAVFREEDRGSSGGPRRAYLKNLLIVVQIALCMVLMIVSGLLVRSFAHLENVALGFDPHNVFTMDISLPTVKYANKAQQTAFFDELLRKVSVLPGVRNAAISASLPLTPRRITPILPEGQPEVPLGQRPFTIVEAVSPDWFQTMSVPITMGRPFNASDNLEAPRVVIINQALAHRYWPNENPVGKHIVVGRQPSSEVVGVAEGVKNNGLAVDSQPQIYFPFSQNPWANMNLLVRTTVEPHQLVSAVRQQIYGIDHDQPITDVQTLDELVNTSRAQPKLMMSLLAVFSSIALVLVIVGIYGVIAYSVAQRRRELGIRLALGAEKSDILQLVVGQGLILAVIGTAIGLAVAVPLTRFISSLLYQVGVWDFATFALSPLLFLLIALFASYLPARRATQVDPVDALRQG